MPQNLFTQFERVANKLNKSWGRLASADYLQDLIFPAQPGRRGFLAEVAKEILALNTLHEQRYVNVLNPVRDSFAEAYVDPTRAQQSQKKGDTNAAPQQETLPKRPSIYSTRPTTSPRRVLARSASVKQLLSQSVRDQLAQIRASRTLAGPTARVPVPAAEADEILLDAERLLEEEHMNSGTALLELITRLYPGHSPYAYVRLMEIYYRLRRREQYDRLCQRMSQRHKCETIEWDAANDVFATKLDAIVQMFLIAKK